MLSTVRRGFVTMRKEIFQRILFTEKDSLGVKANVVHSFRTFCARETGKERGGEE